jgi:hypothetical protein
MPAIGLIFLLRSAGHSGIETSTILPELERVGKSGRHVLRWNAMQTGGGTDGR